MKTSSFLKRLVLKVVELVLLFVLSKLVVAHSWVSVKLARKRTFGQGFVLFTTARLFNVGIWILCHVRNNYLTTVESIRQVQPVSRQLLYLENARTLVKGKKAMRTRAPKKSFAVLWINTMHGHDEMVPVAARALRKDEQESSQVMFPAAPLRRLLYTLLCPLHELLWLSFSLAWDGARLGPNDASCSQIPTSVGNDLVGLVAHVACQSGGMHACPRHITIQVAPTLPSDVPHPGHTGLHLRASCIGNLVTRYLVVVQGKHGDPVVRTTGVTEKFLALKGYGWVDPDFALGVLFGQPDKNVFAHHGDFVRHQPDQDLGLDTGDRVSMDLVRGVKPGLAARNLTAVDGAVVRSVSLAQARVQIRGRAGVKLEGKEERIGGADDLSAALAGIALNMSLGLTLPSHVRRRQYLHLFSSFLLSYSSSFPVLFGAGTQSKPNDHERQCAECLVTVACKGSGGRRFQSDRPPDVMKIAANETRVARSEPTIPLRSKVQTSQHERSKHLYHK
ncbi:hypothetical protein BCR44DRAFT_396496 [Catenaria anguillulae PL171]|uniref:Uncharacterized protein n=1 Tax=Catenaria anguillulae PL171 TaxID=765915 RepID=A0A1Y2HEF1_9FUNG|nr:hypothetical protein BCR44DRAFT_396496 [Catenaria anguillulae PL171]